jgi:hypothetical protein
MKTKHLKFFVFFAYAIMIAVALFFAFAPKQKIYKLNGKCINIVNYEDMTYRIEKYEYWHCANCWKDFKSKVNANVHKKTKCLEMTPEIWIEKLRKGERANKNLIITFAEAEED